LSIICITAYIIKNNVKYASNLIEIIYLQQDYKVVFAPNKVLKKANTYTVSA